jgi:hypothetical protein
MGRMTLTTSSQVVTESALSSLIAVSIAFVLILVSGLCSPFPSWFDPNPISHQINVIRRKRQPGKDSRLVKQPMELYMASNMPGLSNS